MVTNGRLNRILKKSKPYFGVIILQFGYAGLAIIAKSALNGGMSHYTFAVYRNATAAVFFAPFALFFERKARPKMTISLFMKIMLLGLLEPVIDQNLYYVGMKYTTATFTTALSNVLPAITFLLAWIFRSHYLPLVIWGKDKDGKDKSSNHQTAQDDQELSVMGSTSHQEQESATPGDVVPRTRSRRKFCRREEFRPKPVEAVGKFGITRVDHLEMDASPL